MHLVGFTIEIYYDARPYEYQTYCDIFIFYNSVVLFVGPRRLFTKKKGRLQRNGKFINNVERSIVQ